MGNLYLLKLIKSYGIQGLTIYRNLNNDSVTEIKIKNYPNPFYFRPHTKDKDIFRHIILDEDYNLKLGKLPNVIIDAGAYTGYSSVYFANKFKEAQVYAIELDRDNYTCFTKNTANYSNIKGINKALWFKKQQIGVNDNADSCSRSVDSDSNTTIETTTLLDIIQDHGIKRIDILKMDIEGAEKEIFQNEPDAWLAMTKLIAIEIHDYKNPGCFLQVSEALNRMQFEFVKTQSEYLIFNNRNL